MARTPTQTENIAGNRNAHGWCALITYYLFVHDLSVLALPVFVAVNEAVGRRDWLRVALDSVVLSGFAVFWFVRDSFYPGALFMLIFCATEGDELWNPNVPG